MASQSSETPAPQPLLKPGDWVEHFEILRLIGRGGMGEVYLAKDAQLSRRVALKIVNAASFGDERALERFLYEAKITARFNHPHIVTAHSVGDHEGNPYVALEYLEGQTLRERIDDGSLPLDECLSIGRAIASALREAHRHQVLHRDLKPENVIIPDDGRLRVLDFGLAKMLRSPDVALAATLTRSVEPAAASLLSEPDAETHDQGFTGTPFYMAPEQWQSEPISATTDIWGLGVILWEMLVGERPFQGNTIFLLGSRIIADEPAPQLPPPPEGVDAALWQALGSLVEGCLDKDPSRRPSAEALEIELGELIEQGPPPPARKGRSLSPPLLSLFIITFVAALTVTLVFTVDWNGGGGGVDGGASRDATVEADAGRSSLPAELSRRRMASVKSVVRLGTSELGELLGSELSPALFWGLLHTETDGRELPVLTARRPSIANGDARPGRGGGFVVTWTLREGLRWSDGQPLTARDVIFSLQVTDEQHITSSRIVDDRTVEITWDDQRVAALSSIRPLPRHVLAPIFERDGAEAVITALRRQPTPVVGPYHVVEFERQKRLVLEANPHFVGVMPAIPRVEVVRTSAEELIRRYEAGELDVIMPDVLPLERARTLQAQHPRAVSIRPSSSMIMLQPDLRHPLLRSREARQALLQALERERYVEQIFGGEGRVAPAPVMDPSLTGMRSYPHARSAARRILSSHHEDARSSINLFHAEDETERRLAQMIATSLHSVGLRIEPVALDRSELAARFRGADHGGLLLRGRVVSPTNSLLPFLNLRRSASGYDLSMRHSGFDDQLAALVERERQELIPQRRSQLRESIARRYSQLLPTLPIAFAAERIVVHPTLRGWEVPLGDRFGRGIEDWYFVRPEAVRSEMLGGEELDE